MPCVPQVRGDHVNTPVVDEADVKSRFVVGALEGLVPLATDLGLIVKEDSVPSVWSHIGWLLRLR